MVVDVSHNLITEARPLIKYWVSQSLFKKTLQRDLVVQSKVFECVFWPGPVLPDLLAASFLLFHPLKLG